MSDYERIKLEAGALRWAQYARDKEGHTAEQIARALYLAMLNIIPKDDPKRLPILEGAREELITIIRREQDERDHN